MYKTLAKYLKYFVQILDMFKQKHEDKFKCQPVLVLIFRISCLTFILSQVKTFVL